MVICNNCGVAVEDSMRFCSECGAEVLSVSRSMAAAPTPGPAESDDRTMSATLGHARSPAAAATRVADSKTEGEKPRERYAPAQVVAITIVVTLIVLFAGAAVTWMIFKSKQEPNTRNASDAVSLSKDASVSTSASPAARSTPTISAAASTSQSWEAEVTATLGGWVSALEAHDLDAHMSYFADTLDTYYSHREVGAAKVRADLARAFSRYSTLSVRLSDVRVTLDRINEIATATFDKTWAFANGPADKTWSGSVRQMVWLRRIEGRWRIAGLKDV